MTAADYIVELKQDRAKPYIRGIDKAIQDMAKYHRTSSEHPLVSPLIRLRSLLMKQ